MNGKWLGRWDEEMVERGGLLWKGSNTYIRVLLEEKLITIKKKKYINKNTKNN